MKKPINMGRMDEGSLGYDRRKTYNPEMYEENLIADGIENFFTKNGINLRSLIPQISERTFHAFGILTIPPGAEMGKAFGNSQRPMKIGKVNFTPLNLYTIQNTNFRMLFNGSAFNVNGMVQVPSSAPPPPLPAIGLNEFVWADNFNLKENETIDYLFTNIGPNLSLIQMEVIGWIY